MSFFAIIIIVIYLAKAGINTMNTIKQQTARHKLHLGIKTFPCFRLKSREKVGTRTKVFFIYFYSYFMTCRVILHTQKTDRKQIDTHWTVPVRTKVKILQHNRRNPKSFYARQHVMLSATLLRQGRPSVCPSVCPSHCCTASKRRNWGSWNLHCAIA